MRRFALAVVGLVCALGLFAQGLRVLDGREAGRQWAAEAWAALPTTGLPLSSFARVTTLDPSSALLPVSVLNTAGTGYVSRGILATNALSRWLTTFDASGYLTTVTGYLSTVDLSPYLRTFDASGYLATTAWSGIATAGHLHAGTYLATGAYLTTFDASSYLRTFDASGYLATSAWSGIATAGHLHANTYLATGAWSAIATAGHLHDQTYLATSAWAGVATNGHVHSNYLVTYDDAHDATIGSGVYLATTAWSGIATAGHSHSFSDDAHDQVRWHLGTWNISTGSWNRLGEIGTGSRTQLVQPLTWADGDWSGPAIMGNVASNVGTGAILALTTGGLWMPYSAQLHTFTMPSGQAYNAITTQAPGLILLDGAITRRTMLALGTSTTVYYAGTTAGAIQAAPPATTGNIVVTVLLRLAEDLYQLAFGRAWGTK